MKYLFLFLSLFVFGCATVTVKTNDCEATYTTILKDLSEADFSVCGGSVSVSKSDSNTTLLNLLNGIINKTATGN